MIYSGVDDNWVKMELLHDLAFDYHILIEGKDSSEISTDKIFFDARLYNNIQRESSFVGMTVVWALITLEALANQALAEALYHNDAVDAIEWPKGKDKSELAKKINILSNSKSEFKNIRNIAEDLSGLRNTIVHDKPFNYEDLGDGDVKIEYYKRRGGAIENQLRYSDLFQIFESCDLIRSFLLDTFDSEHLTIHDHSFLSLIRENNSLQ